MIWKSWSVSITGTDLVGGGEKSSILICRISRGVDKEKSEYEKKRVVMKKKEKICSRKGAAVDIVVIFICDYY